MLKRVVNITLDTAKLSISLFSIAADTFLEMTRILFYIF